MTQKALIDTGFNGYLSLPLDVVEELDPTSIGGNAVELANASEEDVPLFRGEVTFSRKVMTIPVHGIGTDHWYFAFQIREVEYRIRGRWRRVGQGHPVATKTRFELRAVT